MEGGTHLVTNAINVQRTGEYAGDSTKGIAPA